MFFLRTIFNKFLVKSTNNTQHWGLERAVIDNLNDSDRKWVMLRYNIAAETISANDIVLDAACGSGFGSMILSKNAKMVIGIDISSESIRYSKIKYKRKNVKFFKSDVENMKLRDNFFDTSVGIETIEHIKNYELYLEELRRVTKFNGKIIISTPQKISETPQTPFHVKEFEYDEFKQILENYFTVDKIIGLRRLDIPVYDLVNDDNYAEFTIYLAFCKNDKI